MEYTERKIQAQILPMNIEMRKSCRKLNEKIRGKEGKGNGGRGTKVEREQRRERIEGEW